jgi:hypothetical protein
VAVYGQVFRGEEAGILDQVFRIPMVGVGSGAVFEDFAVVAPVNLGAAESG